MAAHGVEDVPADYRADGGQRRAAARRVTDLFAPTWIVVGLPPVVGAVTSGWSGLAWGALASALCGGIPAVVLFAGVRLGWFGDRHIRDRRQRPKFIALIFALVVLAVVLLVTAQAPHVVVACVVAMLVGLVVVGGITLRWKISFHTAVAAGAVVVLSYLWAPVIVGVVGAVVVALIGWARVVIRDHTPAQVLAGAVAGVAAAAVTLALML